MKYKSSNVLSWGLFPIAASLHRGTTGTDDCGAGGCTMVA